MDMYLHVRVLFSMILGLRVSHLLSGVASIVQHPKAHKLYWVHLLWALFVFLYLIHFWWWEYRLSAIQQWRFPLYFFVT
jgi:cell division protein FtsW (lipid II flippase)